MTRTLGPAFVVALAAAACGEEPIVIVPIIDSPDDADASVIADLTSIRLTVEDAEGADVVLAREFTRNSTIEVGGIEFADNLFIQIDGFVDAVSHGVGRSCGFNVQRNEDPPTPRIFLSRQGRAADLSITAAPRIAGAAFTTPDEKVLLVGGDSQIMERFDPRLNEFTRVDGLGLAARIGATFAMLGATAPRPAVLGGFGAATIDVIGYDGNIDQFPDDGRRLARPNAAAARLPVSGHVLVTGGRNLDNTASNSIALVKLDEARNEMQIELVTTGLAAAREGHAMTQLGEGQSAKVLITGGSDNGVALAQSEIFDPIIGDVIPDLDPRFHLAFARSNHRTMTLRDGSILVIGGVSGASSVPAIEQFSPLTGFSTVAQLPAGAPVIDFSLVTLPDGRGMIVGGRSSPASPDALRSIYLITVSEGGQISVNVSADVLAVGRLNPQLVVMCDGTVLISGGTVDEAVVERFNPNEPKSGQ